MGSRILAHEIETRKEAITWNEILVRGIGMSMESVSRIGRGLL